MNINELFTEADMKAAYEAKLIRIKTHPMAYPDGTRLHIANYTEKAAYDNEWNEVTLNCRGLIYTDDGTVVARPFRKAFNWGDERNAPHIEMDAPVVVTDKVDGSLGILYEQPDGQLAIATRGSFESDQAKHATDLLRLKYPLFEPLPGFTSLFEIVYPENRIVVNYGQLDDLIMLSLIHNDSGYQYDPQTAQTMTGWEGPIAAVMPYPTMLDALAAKPRPGMEGFVVQVLGRGAPSVKIKQDDYVALHRIVTGLSKKTVWEHIGAGRTLSELLEPLPNELWAWVGGVRDELREAQMQILSRVHETFHDIMVGWLDANPNEGIGRARFASRVLAHDPSLRPYLFLFLDHQFERAEALAWRAVKPVGKTPSPANHSEDVR